MNNHFHMNPPFFQRPQNFDKNYYSKVTSASNMCNLHTQTFLQRMCPRLHSVKRISLYISLLSYQHSQSIYSFVFLKM